MIDLNKDNHVRAFVCLQTFSFKNLASGTTDWIFTKFHRKVL